MLIGSLLSFCVSSK